MIARRSLPIIVAWLLAGPALTTAFAQEASPRPAPAPSQPREFEISGYAMLGLQWFGAVDTFDATLGSARGAIFGGGARVGLPVGGLFVDVGGWRYGADGERAFVFQGQQFRLGIPLRVTVTPVEVSVGWRFRPLRRLRARPYVSGGVSSYGYKETSDFATGAENVDERFTGYHLAGGMAFPITTWMGAAWDVTWTTVPDAFGAGGVSEVFNDTNLGGTSLRFKLTIGQ